jgi:hypothetical protein
MKELTQLGIKFIDKSIAGNDKEVDELIEQNESQNTMVAFMFKQHCEYK